MRLTLGKGSCAMRFSAALRAHWRIKAAHRSAIIMHLDLFQRLNVNPASVSVVRFGAARPDVVTVNSDSGDLAWLAAKPATDDATVGGGAGPEDPPRGRS